VAGQAAEIDWREGDVPVSVRFDDPYFSLAGGLEEARYVFLAGNGLPDRFAAGFRIAELGFGSGLNFLATLAAWRASRVPGRLNYTAFEAFPMEPAAMARAHAGVPALIPLSTEVLAAFDGQRLRLDDADLTLIHGDARVTVHHWDGLADAWFLDGFAPAKNPELWEPSLLVEVARHTVPGGTFATYTAAGHVRRALAAAGFEVARCTGFGRKRHMTVGRRAR
jgi:tRNA U34 5-methylaminomethyl-2-thiouridine-forming methyltransferase MnmC